YDPTILEVVSVSGGTSTGFTGVPGGVPSTPGELTLALFNTSGITEPTGLVDLAGIDFTVIGSSTDPQLNIEVVDFGDVNANPLQANVIPVTIDIQQDGPVDTPTPEPTSTPVETPTDTPVPVDTPVPTDTPAE